MAQIFKRENSPNYYARFQIDGRDYCISTKTSKRSEALEFLKRKQSQTAGTIAIDEQFSIVLRLLDEESRKREQPADAAQLAIKRQHMARQILQSQAERLELEAAWDAWLSNPKKRNPKPITITNYKVQWERFRNWVAKHDIKYLHEVTPVLAEEYATDLWSKGITPSTYNAHTKFLRSMFKVLHTRAGLINNPWEGIPLMEKEQEGRRNLTPEELESVCAKAKGSIRYLISLGLYSGMRLGDCVNLRWAEVDLKKGVITHMPMKTRRKNKEVRIPLHPVLQAMLQELRRKRKGTHLFPAEHKRYQNDPSAISKEIQEFFSEDCEIATTEDVKERKHRLRAIVRVGFHSLRHSFVSLCAANHVPQVAIMELVGHGSPAMTALYSHAGDEQKAQAIAALPSMTFEQLPAKSSKSKGKRKKTKARRKQVAA